MTVFATASRTVDAEALQRLSTRLEIEAAPYWGLVSEAEDEQDWMNRVAMIEPNLEAIARYLDPSDTYTVPAVASLKTTWGNRFIADLHSRRVAQQAKDRNRHRSCPGRW